MVARHKLFKNMNLDGKIHRRILYLLTLFAAQLDDDGAISDGGDEYVSPEHQGSHPSSRSRVSHDRL